jgi:hypothetical protein
MKELEAWLKKHLTATLVIFVDGRNDFIAALYDNDRGNHIATGSGETLELAAYRLYNRIEPPKKGEPCKSLAQTK